MYHCLDHHHDTTMILVRIALVMVDIVILMNTITTFIIIYSPNYSVLITAG
jgi:hypothetical protein